MKRLHISVGSADVEKSVAFYTTLFGSEPTTRRDDYAKWMLEDPRVNFVVDGKIQGEGVDHLGIQVEDAAELEAVTARLQQAEVGVTRQEATSCCYHVSDKTWAADPQGVPWETFLTHGEITTYGVGRDAAGAAPEAEMARAESGDACCG